MRPTLSLFDDPKADAVAVPSALLAGIERRGRRVLALVNSPSARLVASGRLREVLEKPEETHETVSKLALASGGEGRSALEAGADGIVYRILGASPAHTTPMQYGGHFLEEDRGVLAAWDGAEVVVLVADLLEPYLDFCADLPGATFAWLAPVPVAEVRAIRPGPLAANAPEADTLLVALP
ncbi:MAG: hypothetical protein KIT11_04485 [Fimbriimonadaceae bacterium]|nr:hypothetical protein [Fimbriimonadaceae bacterium]QYK56849.1 MAG: hypothetical protein KF733_05040 [Fimbriimonadaceae bacterium]